MICHLPSDPLNTLARQALTSSKPAAKSWFTQLRDICLLYSLPHPLILLQNPPSKLSFKKLYKSKIMDHWEDKLRQEASPLSSLAFFKPEFHSLQKPHPILWTAGPNPYEVAKAVVQCRMLSGRYRTERLASHWSSNKQGFCLAPTCTETQETLEHILINCPSYNETRLKLRRLWLSSPSSINQLVSSVLQGSPSSMMQFLLDASTHPQVISLAQLYGDQPLQIVFHLTRSWCFAIHKERARLLGRWPNN